LLKEMKGAETVQIWKLISHHEQPLEAFREFCDRNVVAVGWSAIGDLRSRKPGSSTDISAWIRDVYPDLTNSQTGGPSLWNFFAGIQPGDHVIVASQGRRFGVFEITGPYVFTSEQDSVFGYRHVRPAQLTDLDADTLWEACGRDVAIGHAIRWTVAQLATSKQAERQVFDEGRRRSLISTAIERNPRARKKCLEHHGTSCLVCGFAGEAAFGPAGRDLIHVHHVNEVASTSGPYKVDPIEDLIPLCPNCHSMAHRKKPAFTLKELRQMAGSP
jgi:5-methylcytosine-specific restriction endonuclease McrA